LRQDINNFLRQYRKAPHSTTGLSPAQLFLGRNLRTRLDLVRPENVQTRIAEKQRAEFTANFREFHPGQTIYFLSNNARMDKWLPGAIAKKIGDLHYEINYDGNILKRHTDQIREFQPSESRDQEEFELTEPNKPPSQKRRVHFYGNENQPIVPDAEQLLPPPVQPNPVPAAPTHAPARDRDAQVNPGPRRSTRDRRPPNFYTAT